MKAIRVHQFGGPEVLKVEDVPDPLPGDGQVLVRVHAVGVNPVDTYIRAGIYGPRTFPYTPGSDAAGVVKAVGEGIKRFKVGQRVYTAGTLSGTYAQLALCDEAQVYPLPDNATFPQGAALGVPCATAYYGLFHRGQAQPGECLLVHGATGGVGLAAVQLARAAGLAVIGTAGSEAGRQVLAEQGVRHVLDHHEADYLKRLMSLTNDRGVDLILEMLANVNLGKDLTVLAKRGRVVVIGSRGTVEIDPRNTMARNADIRGMSLMNATESELRGIHAALGAALENGILRPIIAAEMPLADAPRAHQHVMEAHEPGKIVLIP